MKNTTKRNGMDAFVRRERTDRGTEKVTLFSRPVNYFDEEKGEFVPILRDTKEDTRGFEKPIGPFKAHFSKLRYGKRITVKKGERELSWEFIPEPSAPNEKKKRAALLHSAKEEGCDVFLYKNADRGVDLSYTVNENGIKEDIIVKEKREGYRFTFDLAANGLAVEIAQDKKTLTFSDENGECLFTIPAPFMTDAVGVRSDDVFYELAEENGKQTFTVVADESFMNDPSRVFPVTVDPCVKFILNNENGIPAISFTVMESEDGAAESPVENATYITVSNEENRTLKTYLSLSAWTSLLKDQKMKRLELILTPYEVSSSGSVLFCHASKLGPINEYGCVAGAPLRINMMGFEEFLDVSGQFVLEAKSTDCFSAQYYSTGDNAPRVEAEYFYDEECVPVKGILPMPKGTAGEFNVRTGDISISLVDGALATAPLDMTLAHVYRKDKMGIRYGYKFGLNIEETLKKDDKSAEYIYTDAYGTEHRFYEYFYYMSGPMRVDVQASQVETDSEGNLFYEGQRVTRELRSSTGFEAVTKLDGVNKLPLLEQRTEEEAKLEEQLKSCKDSLSSYVKVNKETGAIEDLSIGEPLFSDYAVNLEADEMLMPLSDGVAYRSLCLQKSALSVQCSAYALQNQSYDLQKAAMDTQIKSLAVQKALGTNTINSLSGQMSHNTAMRDFLETKANEQSGIDQSITLEERISLGQQNTVLNNEYTYLKDGINNDISTSQSKLLDAQTINLTNQKNLIGDVSSLPVNLNSINDMQKTNIAQQGLLCQKQINEIKSRASDYLEAFQKLLVNYLRLKAALEKLKKQIPVAYLRKDGIAKGFNAEGDLCVIFDRNENVVAIERDENGYITRVYDDKGSSASLNYENDQLVEFIDVYGKRVSYAYGAMLALTAVSYSDGTTFALTYDDNTTPLSLTSSGGSSDEKKTSFTYDIDGKLTSVTHASMKNRIAYNSFTAGEVTLSSLEISYGGRKTVITDAENETVTYYHFDDYENLCEYYLVEKGLVAEAKKIDRDYDNRTVTTYTAYDGMLYTKTLNSFSFTAPKDIRKTVVTYNQFRQPIEEKTVENSSVISSTYQGGYQKSAERTVTYAYDSSHRLIKETSVEESGWYWAEAELTRDEQTVTAITEYTYDESDRLIREEHYIAGRQTYDGKTITETVYDEKGNIKESYTYNSLAPASKLYTVSEHDERGRMIAEYDATGKHKTTFAYAPDGTLRKKTFPSGAALAYGTSPDGKATSVTASTEDGEENTNVTYYNAGEVTKLESGDNTVQYIYDGKRRLLHAIENGQYLFNATYMEDVEDADGEKYDKSTYAVSGFGKSFERRSSDTKKSLRYDDELLYEEEYASDGSVSKRKYDGVTESYTYDAERNLTGVSGNGALSESYSYDIGGRVVYHTVSLPNEMNSLASYSYTYNNATGKLLSMSEGNVTVTPKTDKLGRNAGKTVKVGSTSLAKEEISYIKHGDHATLLPASVRYTYGTSDEMLRYTYDKMGNISEIRENGKLKARYAYDVLNRLVREDNKDFAQSVVFTYDNRGNILSKRLYPFSLEETATLEMQEPTDEILYTYSGDRMLSYNGETCEYNLIGNPRTYRGSAVDWSRVRNLASYKNTAFTYDGLGRCTSMGNNALIYDHSGNIIKTGSLSVLYGNDGVLGLRDSSSNFYYFKKDVQGNIIALLDSTGSVVVKYVYDAWGNHTVLNANGAEITSTSHIGHRNPFRYRGYYFDTNTGLYYLKSRFYDPETGRFLNADTIDYLEPDKINGLNLYAYCGNNPVMNVDPNGHLVITTSILITALCVGVGVGAVFGGIYGGITAYMSGQSVVLGVISGAVGGAIMGAGAGVATLLMAPLLSVTATVSGLNAFVAFGAGVLTAFGTGAIGGAAAESINQFGNTGRIYDWRSVGEAALQWGAINTAGAFLGTFGEALHIANFGIYGESLLRAIITNAEISFATGFFGMLADWYRSVTNQ